MTTTRIDLDHIARVEGHGNVHLKISDGELESVEMEVVEPARLFEGMVAGRSFSDVSYVASRICGICSSSHVVTNLRAIESIFGVTVSERTERMRELLVYGSYLQNHATHLYLFAAPDFLGEGSVFPIAERDPELYEAALSLKALGNALCTLVGGRSVHPITAVVGGFTSEPSKDELLRMADDLEAAVPFAQQGVDLFASFLVPDIETDGEMLAMTAPGRYPVCHGDTLRFVRRNVDFKVADAFDHIREYAAPTSGALLARTLPDDHAFMTCALARINCSWDLLGSTAKLAAAKAGLRPFKGNPYLNNVAQAVELVDALERCAASCRELAQGEGGSTAPVDFEVREGVAVGCTEAPRGTLLHRMELDSAGRVVSAQIVTPTAQNVANIEDDIALLARTRLAQGIDADQLRLEVEELVRAYDPCLSCSVH